MISLKGFLGGNGGGDAQCFLRSVYRMAWVLLLGGQDLESEEDRTGVFLPSLAVQQSVRENLRLGTRQSFHKLFL